MDPKELKQLTQKWNKKLEKEGLGDIENRSGKLHRYHSRDFIPGNRARLQINHDQDATQKYYTQCEHFLNAHKFKNKRERKIWEMYSAGVSGREIARTLRFDRWKMLDVLKRLKEEMKNWIRLERLDDDEF